MIVSVVFILCIAFLSLFLVMLLGTKMFHVIQELTDQEEQRKNFHS